MKKNYYNPEIKISVFEEENVVTASGTDNLAEKFEKVGIDKKYLTDVDVSAIEWTF